MRYIGNAAKHRCAHEFSLRHTDNADWCAVLLLGHQMEKQTGAAGQVVEGI